MSESHLERIRKLLRLSKSANSHEAALAMQRAMELAAKHAIDLSTLETDPEVSDIIHKWFKAPTRLSREWKAALSLAQAYFHVTVCVSRHKAQVVFVGRTDAVDVADYIVTFLVKESRRQCAVYAVAEKQARRRMTSGKRAAYIHGFFLGVGVQLKSGLMDLMRENSELAIVIASEESKRAAKMDDLVGERSSVAAAKRPKMSAAVVSGFTAGNKTHLNRGLTGPQAPQQLALL